MPVARTAADRNGVVYTPREVAAPMVQLALEPLVRGRSSAELRALRVCDFAAGEGAFLVEVVDVLAAAIAAAGHREGGDRGDGREAAARCIVGLDIDPRAAATARARGCDVRVGDALELDWRAAFPDVFVRGGFDAVIGNPPYVRQEWLAAHKRGLQTYASAGGGADLYVYFLELAHRIVRPGGRFCLVTPNKWLTAAYGRGIRELLARERSVEGLVDLARLRLFAGADAFPCIVWGTVGAAHEAPIRATRVATGSVADALRAPGVPHPRARWRGEPWHIDEPAERALIDRLERAWPALADVLPGRPARGIVTGCNRAFVLDRATRDRLLAADPTAGALVRPFVKGRDIARWQVEPVERYLLVIDRGTAIARHPAIAAHLEQFRAALAPRPPDHRGAWPGRKPGAYKWYELQDPVGALAASRAPRLLYQDIQTGPACALDRSGELVPDTTVWILPTAELYLLAVLNSSLYGWYAQRRFPPALNGAVRPKLAYLRALPIARPPAATRRAIERLVEQRLECGPRAAELEARIDDAVLAAYELSPAERRRVRGA